MLTGKQKNFLRGQAHSLKPTAFIGKEGVTPAVIKQIEETAASAELMKIKLNTNATISLDDTAQALADQLTGEVIARIGRTYVYFLPGKENSRYFSDDEQTLIIGEDSHQ